MNFNRNFALQFAIGYAAAYSAVFPSHTCSLVFTSLACEIQHNITIDYQFHFTEHVFNDSIFSFFSITLTKSVGANSAIGDHYLCMYYSKRKC